tara:strand:- start:32 stop:442 length:411 start_codon:yes stop_codon:yes gene_type:complete
MCFDLGRSGFDNHNVRDSSNNITCTVLLNNKCRNCGFFGHTPKYCKNINTQVKTKKTSLNINNNNNNNIKPIQQNVVITNHIINKFDVLSQDTETPHINVYDLPPLVHFIPPGKSWADQAEEEELEFLNDNTIAIS